MSWNKLKIEFIKQAAKLSRNLSSQDKQRLKPKIDALAQNPRLSGVVKFSGDA